MSAEQIVWCLLSPKGRLTRQEFLLAFGLIAALLALAVHIANIAVPDIGMHTAHQGGGNDARDQAIGFIVIAAGWPILAVEWKRLQDIGRPGYLVVPANAVAIGLLALQVWATIAALVAGLVFLAVVPGRGQGPSGQAAP